MLPWSTLCVFFVVWLQKNYENFDGFVILHGTDTMAYTASALSFMCEHLGKPIILTGSQVRAAVPQGSIKQKDKKCLLPSQDETRSVFRCPSMRWGMMAETTFWGRCWSLASLSFLRWGNGDGTYMLLHDIRLFENFNLAAAKKEGQELLYLWMWERNGVNMRL